MPADWQLRGVESPWRRCELNRRIVLSTTNALRRRSREFLTLTINSRGQEHLSRHAPRYYLDINGFTHILVVAVHISRES
jgi:hypothetical protein